jgi:plastocyanin
VNGNARAARRKQQHEARRRTSKAAAIKAKRQRKRVLAYGAGLLGIILIGLIVIVVTSGGSDEEEELADPGVPSSSITFIGNDFSYRPAVVRGIAGPIELTFKNDGPAGHDLAIVRDGVRLSSWDQANEENLVGKIPFTDKQAETTRTFDFAPGHYQVVCLIPGHLEAGMIAELIVE